MKAIVFDIETSNIFDDVGKADPVLLDLALICIYDYATNKYECFQQHELSQLWPILEKADMLIGFNSLHFDLPLLNKYYSGDLGQIKHLDLMNEIKKAIGHRVGLGRLATGTLGVGKSGDGLEAIQWWKEGNIEKVKAYCLDDVKLTKEIYEYALRNGKLRYVDGAETVEFPIDTSGWQDKQEKAITSTLPF